VTLAGGPRCHELPGPRAGTPRQKHPSLAPGCSRLRPLGACTSRERVASSKTSRHRFLDLRRRLREPVGHAHPQLPQFSGPDRQSHRRFIHDGKSRRPLNKVAAHTPDTLDRVQLFVGRGSGGSRDASREVVHQEIRIFSRSGEDSRQEGGTLSLIGDTTKPSRTVDAGTYHTPYATVTLPAQDDVSSCA